MAADPDRLSFAQFLAWEARQEGKFEFVDGEVLAMSGGTGDHTRIADNFRSRLNRHFGIGSPCYAYGSDRKVKILRPAGDAVRYPDATVTCAENDHGKALIIASPVVILEVVSDSSVSTDTIKKPREYTALPTLVQYVLVDSRERWALSYIRREAGWDSDFCTDEAVAIPHFALRLSFAELYAGTTLEVHEQTAVEGPIGRPQDAS
jgi:Uma2 family endonuclease